MMRYYVLLFVLATLLPSSEVLTAADDPTDAIPDSATLVVRLRRPLAVLRKAQRVATKVERQWAQQLRQLGQTRGVLISNPTLEGVDDRGAWWVAAFTSPDAEPSVVFAILADDADKMESSLGEGFVFVRHRKWVLYTEDKKAAEKIRSCISGATESIRQAIDGEPSELIRRNDLAAYVNVRRLSEAYKAEIQIVTEEIDAALANLSAVAPEVPGMDLDPIFRMYGQAVRGLLRAFQDSESFSAGINVTPQGITIEKYWKVAANSPTDGVLSTNIPSELRSLVSFPEDNLAYFGAHGNFAALIRWGLTLTKAMVRDDDVTKHTIDELLRGYADLKFGDHLFSFDLTESEEGALQTVTVLDVSPIEKMRDLMHKGFESAALFQFGGIKQEVEFKSAAEQHGSHAADVVVIKLPLDETNDPTGLQKRMTTVMYGPDGMTQRYVYLPDRMVQTVGGGKAAMTEALRALKIKRAGRSRSRNREGIQPTRRQLAKKANILALVDIPRMVVAALSLATQSGPFPFPINSENLSDLKLDASYLGFSLTTEPHSLRARGFVPIEQIAGLRKLADLFSATQPAVPPVGHR